MQISWSLLLDRLWHGLFVVHHGWFPMLEVLLLPFYVPNCLLNAHMRLKNASYTAGFQLEFQSMLNSGSRGMGTVSSKIYLMWTTLRIHWRRCSHTERVASKAGRKSETRFLCSMLHISWTDISYYHNQGDPDINRAKFNQDGSGDIVIEPHLLEDKAMCADQEYSSSHIDIEASTSNADPPAITQETSADCLPKEMSDMTIRDDKIDYYNDKEMEGTVVHGHGTERGQVIVTTIGGQNEKSKQTSC